MEYRTLKPNIHDRRSKLRRRHSKSEADGDSTPARGSLGRQDALAEATPDLPWRRTRPKRGVRVGKSRVGKGVFAQKWYRAGEIVGEIEGEVIRDENYSSEYCMDLEDGTCLEPAAPFRYLNHSCRPNCRFSWHDLLEQGDSDPRRRIFLYALRAVSPDEELTIDYGWPAGYAIPCRCGSPSCRGWVVAEEELPLVLRGKMAARA